MNSPVPGVGFRSVKVGTQTKNCETLLCTLACSWHSKGSGLGLDLWAENRPTDSELTCVWGSSTRSGHNESSACRRRSTGSSGLGRACCGTTGTVRWAPGSAEPPSPRSSRPGPAPATTAIAAGPSSAPASRASGGRTCSPPGLKRKTPQNYQNFIR